MRWKTEMQFREEEACRQQEFQLAELTYRQMNKDEEKSLLGQIKKVWHDY